MRVDTYFAIRNWLNRNRLLSVKPPELNRRVQDETLIPEEREKSSLALHALLKWLPILKDDNPVLFPKGRKFPLDLLQEEDLAFLKANLFSHPDFPNVEAYINQRNIQRLAQRRGIQIPFPKTDPMVPDRLVDRISLRVGGR